VIALFLLVGVLGLAVGSFLNVVIYRVPRKESIISPSSHCPGCGAPIRPWHNIPVLGWIWLRGRCTACRAPIGARYPLVELIAAILFVAVTWRLSAEEQGSAIPAYFYFTAIGLALAAIDLDVRRLPNAIVVPAYPVLAVLLAASAWWQGDWWSFARAIIGGAALFAFFLALVLVYPAGMGFGDVRLAGIVGGVMAYLSWGAFLIGAFAGFLLGALTGIGLIAVRQGGRRTAIPFGPFMIAGVFVALFAGDELAGWYLGLIGAG
jgi:leader peptidase (prepilin peptidase)/N-methyltransferase